MVYFCAMNGQFKIIILIVFLLSGSLICHAQQTVINSILIKTPTLIIVIDNELFSNLWTAKLP